VVDRGADGGQRRDAQPEAIPKVIRSILSLDQLLPCATRVGDGLAAERQLRAVTPFISGE